jgi:hypothetical protein
MRLVVAPADLHVISHFCTCVVAEAGLTIARMKPHWPAEFYAERQRILNTKIAGKRFARRGVPRRLRPG